MIQQPKQLAEWSWQTQRWASVLMFSELALLSGLVYNVLYYIHIITHHNWEIEWYLFLLLYGLSGKQTSQEQSMI